MPYLGEVSALLTAMCWTVSSATFAVSSRRAGAAATNHFRLWLALPVLWLLVWVTTGRPWPGELGAARTGLLVASGVIGLVLGDLGYFVALARIGPRVASVLMTTWPAFALLFGLFLGEWPDAGMLLGVSLTVCGVLLVLLRSRETSNWNPDLTRRQWAWGVAGALLGAVGQALGAILARRAMAAGPDLPLGGAPLDATLVRMAAGVFGAQIVALVQRRPFDGLAVLRDRRALAGALCGTAFGPVLGIWLSMVAMHHAREVGVASALIATTPLFMMPVAWRFYRARIGALGLIGTLLAVGGVAVLFLR